MGDMALHMLRLQPSCRATKPRPPLARALNAQPASPTPEHQTQGEQQGADAQAGTQPNQTPHAYTPAPFPRKEVCQEARMQGGVVVV